MAFTLGKSEDELKAQRERTLAEIKAKGGKASAPNLTERLNQIDGALRTIRKNPEQPQNPNAPTTPPPTPPTPPNPPVTPTPQPQPPGLKSNCFRES